ncbi:DUF6230 family protein [Streptomyces sp. NPDC049590]|uniref:DUF6230 family protein n=1 Tax=Streptomyces sp. NPDC049590 TaxID=3154834 RepID=UPI00341A3857
MSHHVGRTRWRRFAVLMVPSVALSAALGIAMAQGALAASFLVSGQRFQVTADTLTARGISIYGMVDVSKDGDHVPVLVTGARHVTVDDLCQSVPIDIPGPGTYTLKLTGGQDRPAEASHMFLDATFEAAGQANFEDIDIGIAQGEITKGPINPDDRTSRFFDFDPSGFGQQADSVRLTDVHVTAAAISAGTFNIPGMRVRIEEGHHDCG